MMTEYERRQKTIKDIFKFLEKVKLSNKTTNVVSSLKDYFLINNELSDKQYFLLCSIYERL